MTTIELGPVSQRRFSDEAADSIRDAIRRGSIPPGSRLVERELAEQLGVSRVPVREAIQRLVDEGLVKKVPRRGTFVYALDSGEIEEISSLRVVLERFVVERVITRWAPEHEARLWHIVEKMRRIAAGDIQQLYEHDLEFHNALWEIADHSLLYEVVSSLRSRINRFLYEAAGAMPTFQFDTYIAAHTSLVEVLKSGDVPAAHDLITRHILDSKERILDYHASP